MENFEDPLAWAISLECPPSALTTATRKLLSNGTLGILMDELSEIVHTSSFVTESRKNIMLHKVKSDGNDTMIQCIKNITGLRNGKCELDADIVSHEDSHHNQTISIFKKAQMLKGGKTKQYSRQTCKHLLETKYNELHTQVEDCKRMIHICQELMPITGKDVEATAIDDMLTLVNSIYHGADKKRVANKIWETVHRTDMCKLWNAILRNQTQSMEKLEALRAVGLQSTNSSRANFNIQIGNICGKRVISISQQCIYNIKVKNRQLLIMQYINNIEALVNHPDETGDWVALVLEIQKLEVKLSKVRNEIDNKVTLQDRVLSSSELTEIISEIQSIDITKDERVRDIKKSLELLKMSAAHIHKAETDASGMILHLAALRDGNHQPWRMINLRSELDLFDHNFDIKAQRKIKVIGDVMGYRHTTNSIHQALIFIDSNFINTISHFSLTSTPIYSLLCCYKVLALNLWLKQWMPRLTEETNWSLGKFITINRIYFLENNIKETINAIDLINAESHHEIEQYRLILDTWLHQGVQEEFMFEGTTVNGTTLKEWLQRYTVIEHLMQKPARSKYPPNTNP